jgi:signal peptidase I
VRPFLALDAPWKIALVVGLLVVLRLGYALSPRLPHRSFMTELLDSGLIAFALVFLLIRPFIVQAFYIPSESMVPTLRKNDRILVNKFSYRLSSPRRGEVVVFDAPPQANPQHRRDEFIKRLIGLPGDRIQIKADEGVWVNGHLLAEGYLAEVPNYNWPEDELGLPRAEPYVVPPGYFFVLGDNRNNSNDSHRWSDPALPRRNVVGRAMVIFWPPHRIGLVR